MQTGLLWFDNNPARELAAKVGDAAGRYHEKFGTIPNTCYVNQAVLDGQVLTVPMPGVQGKALRVLPAPNVLLHHFWIGIEEIREQQLLQGA